MRRRLASPFWSTGETETPGRFLPFLHDAVRLIQCANLEDIGVVPPLAQSGMA